MQGRFEILGGYTSTLISDHHDIRSLLTVRNGTLEHFACELITFLILGIMIDCPEEEWLRLALELRSFSRA